MAPSRFPSPCNDGTIQIVAPGAVRLFKSDGTPLTDLTLDLDHPSGYLAGLLSGDVDVWLEGLTKNTDFVFDYVYKNAAGQVLTHDDIHILIADWDFINFAGEDVRFVSSFPKDDLVAKANGDPDAPDAPESAQYKIRIDGLPTSIVQQLRMTSDSIPADFYNDDFASSGSMTLSNDFGILYSSGATQDVVTSAERQLIKGTLHLNVVHNRGGDAQVETDKDKQGRKLGAIDLDLQAFRPQTSPFKPIPVPANEEAGIRVNGDDDDGNGLSDRSQNTVTGENDLVRLLISISPGPCACGS